MFSESETRSAVRRSRSDRRDDEFPGANHPTRRQTHQQNLFCGVGRGAVREASPKVHHHAHWQNVVAPVESFNEAIDFSWHFANPHQVIL